MKHTEKIIITSLLAILVVVLLRNNNAINNSAVNKNLNNIDDNIYISNNEYITVSEQLNSVYDEIAHNAGIDTKYVVMMHKLAGGDIIYEELYPNIENDNTIINCISIDGAHKKYENSLDFSKTLEEVAIDIKNIKEKRHEYNKNNIANYNSLEEYVQSDIDFYEAILSYTGEPESKVNNFYNAYSTILLEKEASERLVEQISSGRIIIKPKYRRILRQNGIKSESAMKNLTILFSFDETLVTNDNIEKLEDIYTIPYTLGETSRENLMQAAISLVGKVRYVWGGGHSGASYIKGINPVWKQFNNLYPSEPVSISDDEVTEITNEGFGECIKSQTGWCPIHGYAGGFHGEEIYSLDDYINLRSNLFTSIDLTDEKYRNMLSTVDYTDGVTAHVIDGLDCSGFTSWEFNQIVPNNNFNTAAKYFTDQSGFRKIGISDNLLPGDIFAWETHIVTIVGKVGDNSGVYVTIEETPNVLKFGVAYHTWSYNSNIELARQIAEEANNLVGHLNPEYERPHSYCIDTVGIIEVSENEAKETEESTDDESENNTEDEQVDNTEEQENNENSEEQDSSDNSEELDDEQQEDEEHVDWHPEKAYKDEESGYYKVETEVGWALFKLFDDGSTEKVEEYIKEKAKKVKTKKVNSMSIARLDTPYIDEGKLLNGYGRSIEDLQANEIIQYIIERLPVSYILGYNDYNGDIFDKSKVATKVK